MQVPFSLFLKSLHFSLFFLARRRAKPLGIDQNDVLTDAHDLIPRNDEPLFTAKPEKAALQRYDDGGQAAVTDVKFHLRDASELFAVAHADDLLFSEILTVTATHTLLLSVFTPLYARGGKKEQSHATALWIFYSTKRHFCAKITAGAPVFSWA